VALVADLEKFVARTGTEIPPSRMYLMKASLKTNGLNAYVTGIGPTKRIVVWDTTPAASPTTKSSSSSRTSAGNYVLNHVPKGMVLTAASFFSSTGFCARLRMDGGAARRAMGRCGSGLTHRLSCIDFCITIVGFLLGQSTPA